MVNIWKRIYGFFTEGLWVIDTGALSLLRGLAVKVLRLLYAGVMAFTDAQLTLRAMSLVYTTFLSLVPVLAVSFSMLKAFDVHNQIEPALMNFLAPLGPRGGEIAHNIIEFVERMKVGVLGSLGLAMLVFTVISLIYKIESAFNYIWKVRKARSFARRFSDYMSVLLVGPVLLFAAIGITASVMSTTLVQKILSIELFGVIVYFLSKLIPYVLVCLAFSFIYVFLPSVKVRYRAAIAGGIFAGILWESTSWAFASFVVMSTKYTAIYSGFAILIFFMIWLYLNWLILLVGAVVSYYHQYPQHIPYRQRPLRLSNRLEERLALVIMFLVARHFHENREPWRLQGFIERLDLPLDQVQDSITTLEESGLIVETGDEPAHYLPAKDIATIRVREVLDAVRSAGEGAFAAAIPHLSLPEVDSLLGGIDEAVGASVGDKSISDLLG
jgi:membrane protein